MYDESGALRRLLLSDHLIKKTFHRNMPHSKFQKNEVKIKYKAPLKNTVAIFFFFVPLHFDFKRDSISAQSRIIKQSINIKKTNNFRKNVFQAQRETNIALRHINPAFHQAK